MTFRSIRVATVISMTAFAFLAAPAGAQAPPPPMPTDLHNGNAFLQTVGPTLGTVVLGPFSPGVGPGDATLLLRMGVIVVQAGFDAIAPYHPTAIGISSNLGRRPASEYVDNYNKNIAMLYSMQKALTSLYPTAKATWDGMLTLNGLNPNDLNMSLSSPVGIGNRAGFAVAASREHDGMNQLGDEGGRVRNRLPYADTTGYEPRNSAYSLCEPTRWQPGIVSNGNGIFRIQQFVTPQMAYTRPYSIPNVNAFNAPAPLMLKNNNAGRQAYIAETNKIIQASANLTDAQKMTAELFNNKIASLNGSGFYLAVSNGLSLDQFMQFDMMLTIAAFDGAIVTWKEKLKYDSVRPFSAVPYVHGNSNITAWGGPGVGTTGIRASEWQSYLPTADHSDYPSGSACFCSAQAQTVRRYFGSDTLNWSVTFPLGSSVIEPGITPAAPLVLNFPTMTDFADKCAQSRVQGGVHFEPAVIAGKNLCKPVGDLAFEFVNRRINGLQ
jgi:hypothetical protein